MADIYEFQPRAEFDAAGNLAGFIKSCREQLTVFGGDLDFDNPKWDLSTTVSRKGITNKQLVSFCTLETAKSKKLQKWMHPVFRPFAQAYFRYRYGLRPSLAYGHWLAAFRVLEAALKEHGNTPTPGRIDAAILNRATQIGVEYYCQKVAYNIGIYLEELSKFMSEKGLLIVPTNWRNPVKRPENTDRIGREFDKRRQEKLPSDAAIDAIPKIFLLATEPVDILTTSIAAVLLSAPDRINELLNIAVDCEVRQKQEQGKEEIYGLRWMTSKEGEYMIKWIVPSMYTTVQEAIAKIKTLTEEARSIAKWYERYPDKLYLPTEFESLRNETMVTLPQIKHLFDLYNIAAAKEWCKSRKLKLHKKNNVWSVLFSDFEQDILSMLPHGFPIYDKTTKLSYSESLMVVRKNELHSVRATNPCMCEAVSINRVNYHLGGRVEHGGVSIFSRFGFFEPDGSNIKVTTHQFRHRLNTIAQESYMSQLDIAKWSGRKNIHQNSTYNHVPSVQVSLQLRGAVKDGKVCGTGELSKHIANLPVSRDAYSKLCIPSAHVTDIGYCKRDFTMQPCPHLAQCIMCEDLMCIKGIEEHKACLRRNLEETRRLLREAESAESQGYAGATRWVEYQTLAKERMEALWGLLDDQNIPEGSVIHLAPPHKMALANDRDKRSLNQSQRLRIGKEKNA